MLTEDKKAALVQRLLAAKEASGKSFDESLDKSHAVSGSEACSVVCGYEYGISQPKERRKQAAVKPTAPPALLELRVLWFWGITVLLLLPGAKDRYILDICAVRLEG